MEHKYLGMIVGSKLNFQSHIREAIIKAKRGIGIIRYLFKYVSWDVQDEIYKLYVPPHLDHGDTIYYKHDSEFKLDVELTQTSFKKNLAGKSFTAEGGIDACVNFTKCRMIRDRITYVLKYHINLSTCVDPMYMNQM